MDASKQFEGIFMVSINPFMGGAQLTMSHPLGGDFSYFLLIQQLAI